MSIIHTGATVPVDITKWDPDGKEWLSIGWDQAVDRYGAITTSAWILPDDWENHDDRQAVTVEDDQGVEHTNCNQILLSTAATSGRADVTNRVTFADGTILDRSLRLVISDQ